MGEARRRKLAGGSGTRPAPGPSTAELVEMLYDALMHSADPTLSGFTLFPADGSEPIYVSRAQAVRILSTPLH